jgi:hypothetical protein
MAADQRHRPTHCRHGHSLVDAYINPDGRRQCRVCTLQRYRERYRRQHPIPEGLIPYGVTPQHAIRSAAMRQVWEQRRQNYGPSGLTAKGKQAIDRMWARRRRKFCRRGHRLTPENYPFYKRRDGVYRRCRQCFNDWRRRSRRPRPEWVTVGDGRVNVAAHDAYFLQTQTYFRRLLRATHPDTGGRNKFLFERALSRFRTFLKREKKWYRHVQLSLPKCQTSEKEKAA